jgi:hypothetical protein
MERLNLIVAITALIVACITIITFWRKSGAIEGRILARLDNHEEWLKGHEGRVHAMETAGFITQPQHEDLSSRCITALTKQIDENHNNLKSLTAIFSEMERERHVARLQAEQERSKYREQDNIRWNRIEIWLARLEEWIEAEERHRQNKERTNHDDSERRHGGA